MSYHSIFCMLVVVTAMSAFINDRYFKLPKTIALTVISIAISATITQLMKFTPTIAVPVHKMLSSVDFRTTVLDVMLGYLLFAAALHINLISLRKNFKPIFYLASIGVITSTIFTGYMFYEISKWLNFPLSFADCLIFGALISPTDPISVSSVLQTTKNVPTDTKVRIMGESLFNDAAGILLLVILVRVFYLQEGDISIANIGTILAKEALGGILWGLLIGYITSLFLSKTKDTEVSILLTVASASAGYIIAGYLHASGPITMVIAGLVIGNNLRRNRFNETTSFSLNKFWELVDGLLNAFLFVLIGLEMLTIDIQYSTVFMGIIGIVVIFVARFASMLLPNSVHIMFNYKHRSFNWPEMTLLCWGGIRGAISVALALATPGLPGSLVAITYFLVIFSILIQGSSFKWVVNKMYPKQPE